MVAVDPTYPLLPIVKLSSSVLLLFVLLTSFVRHNWNLSVAFLCFWLFIEGLVDGSAEIIWSDNDEVKLHVYCDISQFYLILFSKYEVKHDPA